MRIVFLTLGLVAAIAALPVPQDGPMMPMPYNFNWKVREEEVDPNGQYFDHQETKDEGDRTEGEYRVLFEDGRLMIVTYHVEGESGFVPEIRWEENYSPDFNEV